MTRSIRAYQAAARCDAEAARLTAAADRADDLRGPGLSGELRAHAATYLATAADWRRIAAEEGAKERAARVRCWCGRTVSHNGYECAEHDDPQPTCGQSEGPHFTDCFV
jgi:hypothetical protein